MTNENATIDSLEDMLPSCRPFIRICKHILNLETMDTFRGVWSQRKRLPLHRQSEQAEVVE